MNEEVEGLGGSEQADVGSAKSGAAVRLFTADELLRNADPEPVSEFDKIDQQDRTQDIALKRMVAKFATRTMATQLVVADAVFIAYGFGEHWRMPVAAIEVWLAATVIEVIGVVLVIAKYLFPANGAGVISRDQAGAV